MEKAMAPQSSTLAWKIPWMEEPGRLQSMGSLRVRHDWATSLSLSTFMHWRRKWQPTPVFLPGESHGQKSLVGYSPRGCQESDTTKQLHFHFYFHYFWMVRLFCIYNDLWVLKYHPQKRISCQFAVHSYIVNDINIVNICELAEWQFANNLRKQV